jgi:hypothetical protein
MATANSNPFPVEINTGTALAQAAAAMAPGSWAPFTCNFDAGTLSDLLFVGRDGGLDKRVTEYADKMVWDSTRRKIYFTGGGHGVDDGGDQERTIVYDDLTNTWSSLGRPPWYSQQANGATHGYQHNAFSGSTHYYLQFGSWTVRTRDVTQGNQWSSFAGPAWGGFATGALEWFPTYGGGSLIIVQGFGGGTGRVGRWNGSTWSNVGTPSIGDYHNAAVYSPIKDIMYFGGGEGPSGVKLHTLSNTGTITDPKGVYDVQVLGSGGNDVMGLMVNDPLHVTYRGLFDTALLDGGLGVNRLMVGYLVDPTNVTAINI